jgi:hypothetical protein
MFSKIISLYANEAEKRQHSNAIHLLCEELAIPEDLIRPLYEEILLEMKQEARIKDYLALLVCRTIRHLARGDEDSSSLRLDGYHVKLFKTKISTLGIAA